MTDATTPEHPTLRGIANLAHLAWTTSKDEIREAFERIEDMALAIEAQARPAGASEGLREAIAEFLKRWDDPETYHRLPAVDRLRAALAAAYAAAGEGEQDAPPAGPTHGTWSHGPNISEIEPCPDCRDNVFTECACGRAVRLHDAHELRAAAHATVGAFGEYWNDDKGALGLAHAVSALDAALAAPVASDATLRAALEATASALSDANTIITMMRQHLSHEHPDHPNCAYAVLGIMGDQTREEQARAALPASAGNRP